MDYPPYPPRAQQTGINYWLLFIVIFSAVLLANLASTWIAAKIAVRDLAKITQQLEQNLNRELQAIEAQAKAETERLQKQREQRQDAARNQRTRDAKGIELWRNCMEWSEAATQLKSRTAFAGSKEHCERYEIYVKTGKFSRIDGY